MVRKLRIKGHGSAAPKSVANNSASNNAESWWNGIPVLSDMIHSIIGNPTNYAAEGERNDSW